MLGRGILSMKCTVGGFVDENMVFGDYISENSSNGEEKYVVREGKRSCF